VARRSGSWWTGYSTNPDEAKTVYQSLNKTGACNVAVMVFPTRNLVIDQNYPVTPVVLSFQHLKQLSSEYRKILFVNHYHSDYQNSGFKLYHALIGKQGTFQENLGTSVMRYTKNDDTK
jgi:hypothetical protein